MAQKKTIALANATPPATIKEQAAQLAGKAAGSEQKTWLQTFAASGGKLGGKTR